MMHGRLIPKSALEQASANMGSYEEAAAALGWDTFRGWLDYLPGGGLNIAYEAVDRHSVHGRGEAEALRWLGRNGDRRSFSYADLKRETDRFAGMLSKLGLGRGARVFSLLGRVPELHIAALGALKAGAVFCPLYSAFGPDPVRARMSLGAAELLITTAADYVKKVAPWRHELTTLRHVLIVGEGAAEIPDVLDFRAACEGAVGAFELVATRPDEMALLHFTSGTTGRPKGAVHVHEAVVAHHATGRLVLDLRQDDIFWCTADPGWVTGTSYGIVAPLTCGATLVVDEAEFDAERWYGTLERERVSGHARKRLGAAIAPRQIEIREELPRTRSGKIMRRLLRARELGLPEGDLSTLEAGS